MFLLQNGRLRSPKITHLHFRRNTQLLFWGEKHPVLFGGWGLSDYLKTHPDTRRASRFFPLFPIEGWTLRSSPGRIPRERQIAKAMSHGENGMLEEKPGGEICGFSAKGGQRIVQFNLGFQWFVDGLVVGFSSVWNSHGMNTNRGK